MNFYSPNFDVLAQAGCPWIPCLSTLAVWLTFNSSLSGVSAFTNDITVSSKIWCQLLSLTPRLVWATTQTHLNDCHHFPASLPRKADTDICLSSLEGFSKSGQCIRPTLKAPAGIQTFRLTQESLTLLEPTPALMTLPYLLSASHIAPILLPFLPVFPYRALGPGVRSNPCPCLPKDATPAWRETVPVCFDRVCSMAGSLGTAQHKAMCLASGSKSVLWQCDLA